jgi:hypothetical protein
MLWPLSAADHTASIPLRWTKPYRSTVFSVLERFDSCRPLSSTRRASDSRLDSAITPSTAPLRSAWARPPAACTHLGRSLKPSTSGACGHEDLGSYHQARTTLGRPKRCQTQPSDCDPGRAVLTRNSAHPARSNRHCKQGQGGEVPGFAILGGSTGRPLQSFRVPLAELWERDFA